MFRKNSLVKNPCAFVILFAVAGCTHTIKLYEGKDLGPSELSFLYPHAGATNIGVRYIDDKHINLQTSNAVVHLLPGPKKTTIVNFYNEFFYEAGRHVVKTTWAMYNTPIELKAGFTYFAWTGEADTIAPNEVCLIGMPHSEFVQKFGDHTKVPKTPIAPGPKISCGTKIDANDYVKRHGKP